MSLFKRIFYLSVIFLTIICCTSKNPNSPKDVVIQAPVSKPVIANKSDTNFHKYNLISGKVIFETNIMGNIGTKILYFDDYGKKEREDYFEGKKLRESILTSGKTIYKVRYLDKTAFNMGVANMGVAYRFSWNDVPDRQKREGYAIKTELMNIAGKQCESYKIDNAGIVTIFAGWNGICLYTLQQSKDGSAVSKAISVEENSPVAPETFRLPKGIRVK